MAVDKFSVCLCVRLYLCRSSPVTGEKAVKIRIEDGMGNGGDCHRFYWCCDIDFRSGSYRQLHLNFALPGLLIGVCDCRQRRRLSALLEISTEGNCTETVIDWYQIMDAESFSCAKLSTRNYYRLFVSTAFVVDAAGRYSS